MLGVDHTADIDGGLLGERSGRVGGRSLVGGRGEGRRLGRRLLLVLVLEVVG